MRNVEVIGEAANNILRHVPDFASRHADIPWLLMYAMRNRISHGYDKVDLPLVWRTVQTELPVLGDRIRVLHQTRSAAEDA